MVEERKTEEFEDDRKKWKIHFDIQLDKLNDRGESNVIVSFVANKNRRLFDSDIENLKKDLGNLGKFRIIKQGKEFLEE